MKRTAWWVAALLALGCAEPPGGRLELRILGPDREPIPARVELLDTRNDAHVPANALPLRFECMAAPLPDWAAQYVSLDNRILHRPSGNEHFYVDGDATLDLPPGNYRVRVFHGIETRVARRTFTIEPGETEKIEVALERWVDMAEEGWWSVDDHVHLTRRSEAEDRIAAAWMRAEDLHVANLLQMGTVDQLGVTPQHDFGAAGEARRGKTLVLAGQEHPRTHFLGHTITLGADAVVDERETYIDYASTFRKGIERGGLPGYAHWGIGPARTGLALDAPRGLVFFLEVLQFGFPWYREWYDLLDLGLRMTPTAGTDFPCGQYFGVPGRERFYVQLAAPPTRQTFVDAVRKGRTFVTNGPLLALNADGAGIGDEIALAEPRTVRVEGRVRFDAKRDSLRHVELVVNGGVWPARTRVAGPGELRLDAEVEFTASGWLALRVEGDKIGETAIAPPPPEAAAWVFDQVSDFREVNAKGEAYRAARGRVRPTAAHTGAIFVTVAGHEAGPHRRDRAEAALARLADLEARLGDDRLSDQTLWDWFPYADAVSEEHLRRNRPALLGAIEEARAHYLEMLAAD